MDVSKAKLDLALTDDHGSIIAERKINNTAAAITELFAQWSKDHGLEREQCLVCLEPTGHYTAPVLHTLVEQELPTWLAHPRDIQRSIGLQRGKSDKIDARRIADYARRFQDKARLFTADDLKLDTVKHLLTRRRQLVEERTRYLIQIKDRNPCLGQELQKQFDQFDRKQVARLEKAIGQVERAIEQNLRKDPEVKRKYELVCSVPGVGLVLGAYLMVKTAAFKRFTTPRSLACHAGVVPYDHTSGTSIRGKGHVSHHADKGLKTLLHMAAMSMIRKPGDLQDYYRRKVAEGKSKMVVINTLRNKIIHRIYAVLRHDQPYQVNYVPLHIRSANQPLARTME